MKWWCNQHLHEYDSYFKYLTCGDDLGDGMPKSPHILLASANVQKLKNNLVTVIDGRAVAAIEAEISKNVILLYRLGLAHFSFAKRQASRDWRQKISRLYYAAYNASRAVRLCVLGEYSVEVADHKKVEDMPDGFPNRGKYGNRLGILRNDRNICDYDHTARRRDLILSTDDALQLVEDFLGDARTFLKSKGVKL